MPELTLRESRIGPQDRKGNARPQTLRNEANRIGGIGAEDASADALAERSILTVKKKNASLAKARKTIHICIKASGCRGLRPR